VVNSSPSRFNFAPTARLSRFGFSKQPESRKTAKHKGNARTQTLPNKGLGPLRFPFVEPCRPLSLQRSINQLFRIPGGDEGAVATRQRQSSSDDFVDQRR
jgi:hypothetical protein